MWCPKYQGRRDQRRIDYSLIQQHFYVVLKLPLVSRYSKIIAILRYVFRCIIWKRCFQIKELHSVSVWNGWRIIYSILNCLCNEQLSRKTKPRKRTSLASRHTSQFSYTARTDRTKIESIDTLNGRMIFRGADLNIWSASVFFYSSRLRPALWCCSIDF